ncbi:MAG: tetratricopeptide repeat protein, partial [Ghiorsea sp.]
LNLAYLQKKRSVDAGGNLLGPKLKQLDYNRVFSAAYKQYTDVPVGKLILKNAAGIDYSNVKISLLVKEYMDFPTTTVVERVAAGSEIEVPLLAAFNNRILDIDEDTGVQTEVRAEYYLAGKPHVETLNAPLTIYGKNAIVWDHLDMVGSFATPKDDTLAVFTRQLVNAYKPDKGAVNPQVAKAMTVFNGLSAYGIKYLLDPNTPYDQLASTQLDTVQFPRETLRQRSGDCDDLSILLATALANLGIETAILDVPQHLLMMFNTGISEQQKDLISSNDESLAIIDGKVWVPVEATLIAASFTEAWAEGARKYHLYGKQATMKIMPLATAWATYPPVTLPPADFSVDIPSKEILGAKIKKEWEILSVKALERQVRPYRMMLALDPSNTQAKMQIAIVYAQSGLFERAMVELKSILAEDGDNLSAINNMGNIYYLQKNYKEALTMYQRALEVEPSPDIMVNISMVNYKLGDAIHAKSMFTQATEVDDQVPIRYNGLALLLKQ